MKKTLAFLLLLAIIIMPANAVEDVYKRQGCQSSRVTLYNGSSSSFEIRDMKIDRLQQASENSMVVHLFVDGRYGSYSTNRLDKKAVSYTHLILGRSEH